MHVSGRLSYNIDFLPLRSNNRSPFKRYNLNFSRQTQPKLWQNSKLFCSRICPTTRLTHFLRSTEIWKNSRFPRVFSDNFFLTESIHNVKSKDDEGRIRWSIFKFARPVLYVRPSSFLSPFSVVRPTHLLNHVSLEIIRLVWKMSIVTAQREKRNKNMNIFSSILCILLIQLMWMITFNGRVSAMMIDYTVYCFSCAKNRQFLRKDIRT